MQKLEPLTIYVENFDPKTCKFLFEFVNGGLEMDGFTQLQTLQEELELFEYRAGIKLKIQFSIVFLVFKIILVLSFGDFLKHHIYTISKILMALKTLLRAIGEKVGENQSLKSFMGNSQKSRGKKAVSSKVDLSLKMHISQREFKNMQFIWGSRDPQFPFAF